tara:strand:+ start:4447 stop:6153 length:1707 start_codon:yes stop_codon:yes gene_type:complete
MKMNTTIRHADELNRAIWLSNLGLVGLVCFAVFIPLLVACLIVCNYLLRDSIIIILVNTHALNYMGVTVWIWLISLILSSIVSSSVYLVIAYGKLSQGLVGIVDAIDIISNPQQGGGSYDIALLSSSGSRRTDYIARALVKLERNLSNYRQGMVAQVEQRERLQRELQLAKSLQQQALRKDFDRINQQLGNTVLFAELISAEEVAGDFYEYMLLADGRLLVLVGDVCGKGIAACLVMIKVLTALKLLVNPTLGLKFRGLEYVVNRINWLLCQNNVDHMFVTMAVGLLDVKTGEFEYISAGHNPSVILRKSTQQIEWVQVVPQRPLGVNEAMLYQSTNLVLHADDALLLYTDGVVEAVNVKRQAYDETALETFLQQHMQHSISHIINGLVNDVDIFAQGVAQHDDITLLGVHWQPAQGVMNSAIETREVQPSVSQFNVVVANDVQEIPAVQHQIANYLKKARVSHDVINDVQVCLEEALANIMTHGYGPAIEANIVVKVSVASKAVELTLIDSAEAFNPCELTDTNLGGARRKRGSRGGRGVFLIANLSDRMSYHRDNDRNYLLIEKDL